MAKNMAVPRFTQLRLLLLAAALTLAGVMTGSGSADGQNSETVNISVAYPDGSPVQDVTVCAQVFAVTGPTDGAFIGGGPSFPIDGAMTLQVPVGAQLAIQAIQCSQTPTMLVPTWHNGVLVGSPNDVFQAYSDPIEVIEGTNDIVVTYGASLIRGSVVAPDPSLCRVTVADDLKPVATSTPGADGTYSFLVPPGDYRAEVACETIAAFQAWSGADTSAASTVISVGHGETRDSIDFDLTNTYGDRSTGILFIPFFDDQEIDALPKCTTLHATDGSFVRRDTATADDGDYLLRFHDCYGVGFAGFWYPLTTDVAEAETLTAANGAIEAFLGPIMGELPTVAGEEPDLFDPEPVHVCNGRVATIVGTDGDDDIVGTNGDDVIVGLGGNDYIRGLRGDDIICGGDGNDELHGNRENDWIDGGNGDDLVFAGPDQDIVIGRDGNDELRGGDGEDEIWGGRGRDEIHGSRDADVIRGGSAADFLLGGPGYDVIYGEAGPDILRGGSGKDFMYGGTEDDILLGQSGRDTCFDVAGTAFVCERVRLQ